MLDTVRPHNERNFPMRKTLALMTAVVVLICAQGSRGQILIKGTVMDSLSSAAISGVSVLLNGTGANTTTDAQGKFTLTNAVSVNGYAGRKVNRSIGPGYTMKIFSQCGEVVRMYKGAESVTWPGLANGIYIIEIERNGIKRVYKAVRMDAGAMSGNRVSIGDRDEKTVQRLLKSAKVAASSDTVVASKSGYNGKRQAVTLGDTNVVIKMNRMAPVLTLTGTTISWPAIPGATDYHYAISNGPRSDTGRTTTYGDLGNVTSWTPPTASGQTLYYGIEDVTHGVWSTNEVSITWPGATGGFARNNVRWSWTANLFGYNSADFYDRALTNGTYEGVIGMNMKHIREDRNLDDAHFLEAAKRNVKVLPILGSSVNDDPNALADGTRSFIGHYGRGGTFWQAGQPGAPYAGRNLEVDWIEWVNEPYVSCMGGGEAGIAAAPKYAALVKAAYQRLKGYPEGARVKIGISVDLTYYDCTAGGQGSGDWVRDMVRGADGVAGVPDFFSSGGYFDAITMHPYGGTDCVQTDRWCFFRIKEIIARIDSVDGSSNAHAKEIWFTEDGAGTNGQLANYQSQIAAMENDPVLKTLPVRGWSWHHYLDYTGWDQGLTVNGYLNTCKPAFAWVRDNLVNQTPAHTYEGQ